MTFPGTLVVNAYCIHSYTERVRAAACCRNQRRQTAGVCSANYGHCHIPPKVDDRAMPVLQDGLTPLHFAACNGHIEAELPLAASFSWVIALCSDKKGTSALSLGESKPLRALVVPCTGLSMAHLFG